MPPQCCSAFVFQCFTSKNLRVFLPQVRSLPLALGPVLLSADKRRPGESALSNAFLLWSPDPGSHPGLWWCSQGQNGSAPIHSPRTSPHLTPPHHTTPHPTPHPALLPHRWFGSDSHTGSAEMGGGVGGEERRWIWPGSLAPRVSPWDKTGSAVAELAFCGPRGHTTGEPD